MAATPPDPLDQRLTALLIQNARESVANLARQLGTARTTVIARMRRLERDGRILGYTVKLGSAAGAPELQAYVGICVAPKAGREVVRELQRMPEVRQLSAVSGDNDYIALLVAAGPEQLDRLLDSIGELEGVSRTSTSIVLARKIERPVGGDSPIG